MRQLRAILTRASDSGASAVEYGLLMAAVAAVVVGGVFGLGAIVQNTFDHTSSCLLSSGLPRSSC